MGNPRVTGAIGWCAFDYNTHREFGSGDRICYHGVMDIFRLPKFAAEVYRAQGAKAPFVSVASFFTHGDRSTGGNNPLHVLSNCDEIEVFVGTQSFGRHQPDRATFPHLPHPPFKVPGLTSPAVWAATYLDLRVVGYKGGQAVAEQYVEAGTVPRQLILRADDEQLHADGADMTRLSFKIADKYGNRLPFAFAPIHFEIEGAGELIGQNPFPLAGGQGALYLKATKQAGVVTVRATTPRLAPAEVKVSIG
jgi:beta-galactosidase